MTETGKTQTPPADGGEPTPGLSWRVKGAIALLVLLAIYLLVVNLNSVNDELAELAVELKFLRG